MASGLRLHRHMPNALLRVNLATGESGGMRRSPYPWLSERCFPRIRFGFKGDSAPAPTPRYMRNCFGTSPAAGFSRRVFFRIRSPATIFGRRFAPSFLSSARSASRECLCFRLFWSDPAHWSHTVCAKTRLDLRAGRFSWPVRICAVPRSRPAFCTISTSNCFQCRSAF